MADSESPKRSLPPPQDRQFTFEELAKCNGKAYGTPLFVSIKGTVFDVSSKPEVYGPGRTFNMFTGNDASKAIGMSTIRSEHCVSDYGSLTPYQITILDGWYTMFKDKYPIVGRVIDLPPHAPRAPTPEPHPVTPPKSTLKSLFSSKSKGASKDKKLAPVPSSVSASKGKGKDSAAISEMTTFSPAAMQESLPLPVTASTKGKGRAT